MLIRDVSGNLRLQVDLRYRLCLEVNWMWIQGDLFFCWIVCEHEGILDPILGQASKEEISAW